MNAKLYGALFGLALAFVSPAKADYQVKDANGNIITIKSGVLGGGILPWTQLVDGTGNPLGAATNPLAFTFGTGALLPQFASPAHFICDSGCSGGGGGGTSSNFGSTFPAVGTALGISNGTNMVALTLGQAVAGASLPVVLPAAQITALTPLSSVTVTQGTGTNLHMVCDSGCSSSSSPTFGNTFPTTGTPIGMSQGGNLVALTGTGGNLNVNIAAGTAGAVVAGAFVDGWDSTQGFKSDTAYVGSGSASVVAVLKGIYAVAANPITLGGASGGWTRTLFPALSTTVQTVKGSAGQLGKLYCDNPNATAIYVETFDSAGTVTLGTTVPTQAYYIPATNAAGFSIPLVGDQYTAAIKIAAVTAYNGSTAPGTPGNCNVSWN
jgi:hypothetical protein